MQEIRAGSDALISILEDNKAPQTSGENYCGSKSGAKRSTIFDKLAEINPDVYGILLFPDLELSFPVVLSESGDYIKKNFSGEMSSSGAVFINRKELDICKSRIILNAHNMKNGSMFGFLKEYKSSDFALENSEIEWITATGRERYKFCGYAKVSAESRTLQKILIEGEDAANGLKELMKAGGRLARELSGKDHLIILSTCEYTHKSGRLLVIYKRI